MASQFHPEFKSRPTRPAPLFRDFVGAAVALRAEREQELDETCATDEAGVAGRAQQLR